MVQELEKITSNNAGDQDTPRMLVKQLKANWFKVSLLAACIVALIVTVCGQEQERNRRLTVECRTLGEKIEKEIAQKGKQRQLQLEDLLLTD